MPALLAGWVDGALQGALIGGAVGLVVGVLWTLFGPKRRCPECDKPLPTAWVKPVTTCPHCGCTLPPPGKKK